MNRVPDAAGPRAAMLTPPRRLAAAQTFARAAKDVSDLAELRQVLLDAVHSLGFDYFALLRHAGAGSAGAVRLIEYPAAWQNIVAVRGYLSDDPVLVASEKSAAPFFWSDISRLIEMTPRQREILDAAAQAGLGAGFTIPIHVPGECAGCFSFVTRTGRPLPTNALPAAQFIGSAAFEAARRLTSGAELHSAPRLTPRQFECIVLVAQGKSDWDVGRLLGISDQTVHKHIEDAKRRYGVATRIQLVVRSLFDSQLTFGDVLTARHSPV